MKNKLNFNQRQGFTLIELVIVMGILVIVLGLSMSSMLQSQSFQVFNNNFGKLMSLVSNARSQAITGKGQLDYTDFDGDGIYNDYVTPANYGVRFDTAPVAGTPNVRLFSDTNPLKSGVGGKKGQFDDGGVYAQGDDVVLDSLTLPNNTVLEVIDGASLANTPTESSIFFSMKYADITYESLVTSPSPFITIQLTEQNISACRQIQIHKLAGIPEVGPCT